MPEVALMKGKIALVTGGASGIGAATARLLRREGAEVWIADRDDQAANAMATTIDGVNAVTLDVTKPNEWDTVLAGLLSRYSRIDMLINAAGISRDAAAPDPGSVSLESWRQVFSVNVEGTLLGCQAAIRAMRASGGAIVNISSMTALGSSPGLAAYGASKAAVLQLTKTIAAWCAGARMDIRCNAVLPGMTDTPLLGGMNEDYRRVWEDAIPAHRFAEASEIAEAIVFLAGPRSRYINGVGLLIDGGVFARPVVQLVNR